MNTSASQAESKIAFASAVAAFALPAQAESLDEFLAKIKSNDEAVRTQAWRNAGPLGGRAIVPLAGLMSDPAMEVARAAKRALWQITHHSGRPGAGDEKTAVAAALASLLKDRSAAVGREILLMVAEIGSSANVPTIASLLGNEDLRDHARMALEQIPGTESLDALRAGLESVEAKFKAAIAHSLRVRGVKVEGYPSQKRTPTRPAPGTSSKQA